MLQVWKPLEEMTLFGKWPEMVWPRWASWKTELPVTRVESTEGEYLVSVEQEPIACLAFSGAAWRVEGRDRWTGWNDDQRRRNFLLVLAYPSS